MSKVSSSGLELFAPDSRPFGRTYAEWTAEWWKWILSIPKSKNPLLDQNGKNCANDQSGPVWFLAGTLGGAVERSCVIPHGKAILFPIINIECSYAEGDGTTGEELAARAKFEMDQITNIHATVNGTRFDNLQEECRIRSPLFDVTLPDDCVIGLPAQTTQIVSEGFWLFLKSFQPGWYDLHTFGSCLAGRIKIGVSYHLTVGK
jgi:hypothetical protein